MNVFYPTTAVQNIHHPLRQGCFFILLIFFQTPAYNFTQIFPGDACLPEQGNLIHRCSRRYQ
jgi:hypothetical protein